MLLLAQRLILRKVDSGWSLKKDRRVSILRSVRLLEARERDYKEQFWPRYEKRVATPSSVILFLVNLSVVIREFIPMSSPRTTIPASPKS